MKKKCAGWKVVTCEARTRVEGNKLSPLTDLLAPVNSLLLLLHRATQTHRRIEEEEERVVGWWGWGWGRGGMNFVPGPLAPRTLPLLQTHPNHLLLKPTTASRAAPLWCSSPQQMASVSVAAHPRRPSARTHARRTRHNARISKHSHPPPTHHPKHTHTFFPPFL